MRISDWSSYVCSSDLMACRYELECPTSTHRPPRPQRLRQRPLVEIIQLAAHGQTMRELRQPYRITLEPLGEIMCGRLPLQRRVHREQIGRASCRERVCQYV